MQFHIKLRRRGITKHEILNDLKRVAADRNVATVTKATYDDFGAFGATTVLRLFGSWNEAIKTAGLRIAVRQNISEEELFQNIASVWTDLGRQPYRREMSDKNVSEFSLGTYEKRFGTWNKALSAFAAYINGISTLAQEDKGYGKNRTHSKRTSRTVNWRMRARILIRDGCICQMCGDSPTKSPGTILHVDHKLPWSKGGETVEENLRVLCERCNIGRSNAL